MPDSSNGEQQLWEALEILDKKGNKYLVAWAGTDPDTGKPYEPTWEPKENCTRALLATWKAKRAQKKKSTPKKAPSPKPRPKSISISSSPVPSAQGTPTSAPRRRVPSRQSTATPADRKHTQTSESTPFQPVAVEKDTSSPSLHKRPRIKRKPSVNVVISPKTNSLSSLSAPLAQNTSKAEATKQRPSPLKDLEDVESPDEEQLRVTKKRRLVKTVVDDSQPEDEAPPRVQSDQPLDIISIPSQSSIKELQEQPHEKSKESSKKSSRGRSQSRQLSAPRERSISPITKVDTWFAVSSAKELEEEQRDNNNLPISENIYSGIVSQVVEPAAVSPSEMNPSGQMPVLFQPTVNLIHGRQPSRPQSQQTGRQSPIIPASQQQRSIAQGRRASSVVSFTSMISLKERLQTVPNQAKLDEIVKLTSYPKKTPSLSSSVTGSSLLSAASTASSKSTADLASLRLVTLGENEKILAVQGSELQSRMSRGVIINRELQIREFCLNSESANDETVAEMKTVISTCSGIATHPYLVITPPLANADLPEKKEAEYLVAVSGKFTALGKILDSLKDGGEVRVGIMIGSPRGMDLVEGFLRGKGIKVTRTDGAGVRDPQVVESRGGPNVTLVLGGKAGARAIVNRVDVVIAMDLSFNQEDDQALRLRQHPINIDELSPVIRLVTINSAEHVRLCLPSPHEIPSDKTMLQALVSATSLLRNFNGVEIPNDDARYPAIAEFIREKKDTDVFGIRDIESYMAGTRGLAGLALKRARPPTDDQGPNPKRPKISAATWQLPSLESLQRENDELRTTLGQKETLAETLRTDLASLSTKFQHLEIQNHDLEDRLQKTLTEHTAFRDQLSALPNEPPALQAEILKLQKALENKTRDFDYVTARYQEASAAAASGAMEVAALKAEVEGLRRRVEGDVKRASWEGERAQLIARVGELEERCRLLEEREKRLVEKMGGRQG